VNVSDFQVLVVVRLDSVSLPQEEAAEHNQEPAEPANRFEKEQQQSDHTTTDAPGKRGLLLATASSLFM
jgi:hypothetical protein